MRVETPAQTNPEPTFNFFGRGGLIRQVTQGLRLRFLGQDEVVGRISTHTLSAQRLDTHRRDSIRLDSNRQQGTTGLNFTMRPLLY